MGRDDRQICEGPLTALYLVLLRCRDLQKVPDRRGNDVFVAFEVVALAREAAQRARYVGGDGRLLCDDERFGHSVCPNQEFRIAMAKHLNTAIRLAV